MTPPRDYGRLATALGDLVTRKQREYGDSAGRSHAIVAILYPQGVPAHAYRDVLLLVRVIDKLSRIAQRGPDRADLGGESPWADICGYALLGWAADEEREERAASVSGPIVRPDRLATPLRHVVDRPTGETP